MAAPQTSSLLRSFYPGLDGLRSIAFFMVFLFHYGFGSAIFSWGWVGVDLFFVLSGFLITGILYDSLHREDFFRNFYIRRCLRIFPLYYGFFLVLLLLTPFLHIAWSRYNVALAAYIGNWFMSGSILGLHADPIMLSFQKAGKTVIIDMGPFWSLCVEEQFYLVWPAVVYLVRSRTALLRLCLAALVIAPILRTLYFHLYPAMLPVGGLYFPTLARTDGLLAGAAAALWLRGPALPATTIRRAASVTVIAAPLLLAFFLSLEKVRPSRSIYDPVVDTIGYSLLALAAVSVLFLAIDPASPLVRLLQIRPLPALGRITYGLYFFHGLALPFVLSHRAMLEAHHLEILGLLGPLAFAIVLAWLSFRFYESPFLRLKSIFAPRPGVEDPPPAPAL